MKIPGWDKGLGDLPVAQKSRSRETGSIYQIFRDVKSNVVHRLCNNVISINKDRAIRNILQQHQLVCEKSLPFLSTLIWIDAPAPLVQEKSEKKIIVLTRIQTHQPKNWKS